MRASARFQAALRNSHEVWEYIDVVSPSNQTVRLSVTTASITVDRTAQFRRSAIATCFDPTGAVTPKNSESILTPFGTTVLPYRGIRYSDGTIEVYPLGIFNLANVTVTEANPLNAAGTTIQFQAYDQSRAISRNKFQSPFSIAAGALVTTSIQQIVQMTYPDQQFKSLTHHQTNPYALTYAPGDDAWKACNDLATAIGCQVYFDAEGYCVINTPADISNLGSPDWDYIEGQGCTMTDISAVYTDDPGYNGVIITGASTGTDDPPVQGEAWDDDPTSPTYRYGPYGQVPYYVQNTLITTTDDANATAASLLNLYLGFASEMDISCWTNPALDIDDVIQVERGTVNATGKYVLDSMQIPMGATSTGGGETEQTMVVRQKRSVGA